MRFGENADKPRPHFLKINKKVRYAISDLDSYIAALLEQSPVAADEFSLDLVSKGIDPEGYIRGYRTGDVTGLDRRTRAAVEKIARPKSSNS